MKIYDRAEYSPKAVDEEQITHRLGHQRKLGPHPVSYTHLTLPTIYSV